MLLTERSFYIKKKFSWGKGEGVYQCCCKGKSYRWVQSAAGWVRYGFLRCWDESSMYTLFTCPSLPLKHTFLTSNAILAEGKWLESLRKLRMCSKYDPSRSMKYLPSLSVSRWCLPLNMAASMELLCFVSVERVVTNLYPPTLRDMTRGKVGTVEDFKQS